MPTQEDLETQDSYEVLSGESPPANVDIPIKAHNRKKTDSKIFLVYIIYSSITVFILVYTLIVQNNSTGDVRDTWKLIYKFLSNSWLQVLLTCMFPLGLSLVLAQSIQHDTTVTVWIVVNLSWITFTIITIILWWTRATQLYTAFCGISTVILVMVLVLNFRKMNKAILFIKKSCDILPRSSTMFYISLAAFCLKAALLLSYVALIFLLLGTYYIPTAVVYILLGTIVVFWTFYLIVGIENMTLSFGLVRGYFLRRPTNINQDIRDSFCVIIKNHLGTIAAKSFLFCVVNLFVSRLLVLFFKQFSVLKEQINVFMKYVDGFFSRHLYIITAMHGTSFVQSGQEVVKMYYTSTDDDHITVKYLADLILTLNQTFITVLSMLITFLVNYFLASNPTFEGLIVNFSLVLCVSYVSTQSMFERLKTVAATVHLCIAQQCLIDNEQGRINNMTLEMFLSGTHEFFGSTAENQNVSVGNEA